MNILFLIKEGFRGFRTSKLSFFLTCFTCFISLSLLGIFTYLFLNANLLVEDLKNRIEVEVFLNENVTQDFSYQIFKTIKSKDYVKKAEYISKEKAKQKFLKETGIDFQSILTSNPLPASVTIELGENEKNQNRIQFIIDDLKRMEGIDEVVFNHQLLETIENRAKTFRNILLFIFGLVTIATILLISNTIKLNIYSKIDEINVMRLVGAKNALIKMPFIFEGIIVGTISGFFSACFIVLVDALIFNYLEIKSIVSFRHLLFLGLFLISSGIFFGYLGSAISIRKFFKMNSL